MQLTLSLADAAVTSSLIAQHQIARGFHYRFRLLPRVYRIKTNRRRRRASIGRHNNILGAEGQ
jgi:hypothetical protein